MIRLATFIAPLALWAAAAGAAPDKPVRAPAGDWVVKIPIPPPDPAKAGAPVQSLLFTTQGRFDPAGDDEYVEFATLVQNPQGLAALGTLAFPWQPDQMDLIVHKLQILRGTQVIDLLASGQDFTVLRRENNLEAATLDGILTAVIQPEGLAVGDIIDVALTYRRRPGAVPFRSESLVPFVPGGRVRHAFIRQVWPDSLNVRWHASAMMGHPQVRSTRLGKELVIDLKDIEAPALPTDAPPRFSFPESVEASAYGSWSDISRLMYPLFVTASTLPADSPVKAEIARIAGASADPTRRMMAALRLVQDKVRYVAIAMGDGGYTPAPANQTWARKFGDCKGKTALLIALLQGLGIEAEPVLVNSQLGDGLDQQLPMARLFDHVIVRARIGDKTYWLDGTRSGDREAEDLLSSPLGFGLPLEAAGAELARLPLLPPREPLIEVETIYDASKGFEQRVPFSGHVTYRGDLATAWRVALADSGEEKLADKLKDQVPRIDNDDIKIGPITADEEANRFGFAFSGSTRMDWDDVRSSGAKQFRFDDHGIKWEAKFERPAGPTQDLPFQLPFPAYDASREVVILPGNGVGYTIEGTNLDRTVANTEISRHLSLAGGKAVAETRFRRLKPEIGAAEAKAALPILALVNGDAAWVRTPPHYETSIAERQALLAEEPKSASDFVLHGFNLMRDGHYSRAVADFERAAALRPDWSLPQSDRAVALVGLDKLAEAESAAAKAIAIDPDDAIAYQALGMLHSARGENEEALKSFSRSLELEPDNEFTLLQRAMAYDRLGKPVEALADAEHALRVDEKDGDAYRLVARLDAASGNRDGAIAAMAKARRMLPSDSSLALAAGELYRRLGRDADAQAAFAEALRLVDAAGAAEGNNFETFYEKAPMLLRMGRAAEVVTETSARLRRSPDNQGFLALRCLARATGGIELEAAAKDCDSAVAFDPRDDSAHRARALLKLRLKQWDAAIADYDAVLAVVPRDGSALFGRGIAKARRGDRAGADRDIATARRYDSEIAERFEEMGLTP